MKIVLEQVFLLILFAVVGFMLCRLKLADSKHAKLFSCLELYLFLPAAVFNTFSSNFTKEYIVEKYPLLIISSVIIIGIAVAAIFISRLFSKDSYQKNIYKYSLTVPNYGYMGYALASGIFGEKVLLNVMIFSLPISIYTYAVGLCMLTKTKLSLKKIWNPVILAMFLGAAVGFFKIEIPNLFDVFLLKSAACMAPVSMILSGMVISEFSLMTLLNKKENYMVSVIRLLLIPCVLAIALRLLSLDLAIIPALMIYAMPCGLNTIVFPRLINENCETGASLAFISSILACITIPLCLGLFM